MSGNRKLLIKTTQRAAALFLTFVLLLSIAASLSSCSDDEVVNDESVGVNEDPQGEKNTEIQENNNSEEQAQEDMTEDTPSLALADSFQRNVTGQEVPKPTDFKLNIKYEINCRLFRTAIIDDGTVYTDCGNDDAIIAIDQQSGMEKWRFAGGEGFVNTPVPVNGTVYASSEHNLFAIDAATGTGRWSFKFYVDNSSNYSTNIASADNQAAYIQDSGGVLHALDAMTGQELWHTDICNNYLPTPPIIAGDYMFVGTQCYNLPGEDDVDVESGIIAINKNNGEKLWTYTSDSQAFLGFIVYDGTIFAVDLGSLLADSFDNSPPERSASSLCAIDALSGGEKWCFNKDSESLGKGLAIAGGVVVVGSDFDVPSENGLNQTASRIYALDANTGGEKWSFDTEGKLETEIFIAGPAVLFGSIASHVSTPPDEWPNIISHTYCRDLQTGEHKFMIFNEEGEGADYGLPPLKIVSDGRMYFLSEGDESARLFTVD